MFDWNDLRYLIAAATAGSTTAAARELGVNQTTVARRIDALERALGVTLFERRIGGYVTTARGRQALEFAERMAREAQELEATVGSWRRGISGVLRVTTTEVLAMGVVAPLIAELRETQPELEVELIADDRRLDLRTGEADVAIRLGAPDPEPDIVGRCIGESRWALFAARGYLDRRGMPKTTHDLVSHQIIAGSGALVALPAHAWVAGLAPAAPVVMRCNSVPNLAAAVRSGVGIGPLPLFATGDDPELVRCLPELGMSAPIWLLYRATQRNEPHVRAFAQAIAKRFAQLRERLGGAKPQAASLLAPADDPAGTGKPT